jgi:hypothetical protein
MAIDITDLLLLIHVLFFCFWLGTDIGVFYSSRFVLQTDIGVEARAYCLKIMGFLDQIPRVSMIGITAVGATLAILRGYFALDPLWILPIWIVATLWAAGVIYLYVHEHEPAKIAAVRRVDFNFRLFMIALVLTLGVTSLMGHGITDQRWLALKLLVLTCILTCGVLMRLSMRTFGQYFGPMMKGTARPEQVHAAQAMMATAKRYVLCIYALLVIAAALGLWKPA